MENQLEMFQETIKFVRVQFVSEGGPVGLAHSPEDIAQVYRENIATRPEYDTEVEQFSVLIMDTRNNIKAAQIVTKGILNSCMVHAREVFRPAVACNGAAVIVAHNHPSGQTNPSPEDLKMTRELIEAGKILGIRVLDHIIISDSSKDWHSLRESGLVNFSH